MKKFLREFGSQMWKMAKCLFYIGTSACLVLFYPGMAIAFLAIWISKKARNEYERVIISAAASVFVAFRILNFAEIAILATVLPVHSVIGSWGDAVAAA